MKILHTSDWHLGQYFMMKTRENEHKQFLTWLVAVINDHKVDAVIVAGDIFDSASPASYARKLYADFIVQLQQSYCSQLVIVSGNHDSVAVLNESKSLLRALNVSVLAGLSDDLSEHIISLEDKSGKQQALLCALPFLRATDVMLSEQGSSAEQKQMSLQQGIADTYQTIYELAVESVDETTPILATGHLTAVGCAVSDSVREIYIGTLTAFPSSLFPAFDYIALGHIHKAQRVQKSDVIRYCGSPIPLSFDESKQTKQVNIIEFTNKEDVKVDKLDIPVFQPLKIISGDLESMTEQINTLKNEMSNQSVWVEIKLKQAHYMSDLQSHLSELVEGTQIDILKVSSPQINEMNQWQESDKKSLDNVTPEQLFDHRLDIEENISEEQKQQLKGLFAEVLSAVEHQS
ncbi:exonuclease subunit SbcD [Psychromonas sp. RZ22]|uniref:exonuclease subunit SbcD n=1 Tax=Psychromonas algarum TaxID=2555643 RepID=UPI001067F9A8|nr:exonuclease subunit SbcD [Psychromonas sp. RZ22]TEW53627.1 exonuclease subunit SbcD [Psychromonas sp. RZ22]